MAEPLSAAERIELARLLEEVAGISVRVQHELARNPGYRPRSAQAELSQAAGCLDQAGALLRRGEPAGST